MDVGDGHADREEDGHHAHDAYGHDAEADGPAPDRMRDALAAVAERDGGGEAEQHEPGEEGEPARHVAGSGAVEDHVVDVATAVDGGEDAERPRDRGAHTGPQ